MTPQILEVLILMAAGLTVGLAFTWLNLKSGRDSVLRVFSYAGILIGFGTALLAFAGLTVDVIA